MAKKVSDKCDAREVRAEENVGTIQEVTMEQDKALEQNFINAFFGSLGATKSALKRMNELEARKASMADAIEVDDFSLRRAGRGVRVRVSMRLKRTGIRFSTELWANQDAFGAITVDGFEGYNNTGLNRKYDRKTRKAVDEPDWSRPVVMYDTDIMEAEITVLRAEASRGWKALESKAYKAWSGTCKNGSTAHNLMVRSEIGISIKITRYVKDDKVTGTTFTPSVRLPQTAVSAIRRALYVYFKQIDYKEQVARLSIPDVPAEGMPVEAPYEAAQPYAEAAETGLVHKVSPEAAKAVFDNLNSLLPSTE